MEQFWFVICLTVLCYCMLHRLTHARCDVVTRWQFLSSNATVAFLTCLYNRGFKGDRCFEVTINSWRTALSLFAVGFLV